MILGCKGLTMSSLNFNVHSFVKKLLFRTSHLFMMNLNLSKFVFLMFLSFAGFILGIQGF